MNYRFFVSQCALAAVAAAVALVPAPVVAQTPSSAKSDKAFTPPKTPWGDPNLQGVWPSTNMIGTPLQRDAKLGTRTVLNDAELAERQRTFKAEEEFDTAETVSDKTRCDPANPASRIPGTAASLARPTGPVYPTCGANGVTIGPPLYWDERGKLNSQASLIVDPPNGRLPAMTPEAQKEAVDRAAVARKYILNRGGTDTWEDRSLTERCITWGPGLPLPSGYDSGNQIIQGPGYVAIVIEKVHETRVIPLDGRPHPGPEFKAWLGDSRGHWEGNTLVVETTNFNGQEQIGGVRTSDAMRLVERYTMTGPDTLNYELKVDDPKTWTSSWTVRFPLKRDNNYKLYEYACHEANYSMYNLLTGARAEEKKKGLN
jgi:hypothetical protein